MGKNHSMSRVERSRREKVTRYSVRKVSFGAASVAVAAFFMFLGNGAVYAAEPNVTATGSALAATPANNQLDENSGASDSTAPKAQADTTTPTPTDSSSTSVESAPASKVQADTTTSKPADATSAPVVSSTTSATEEVEEKATPDLDKKQLEEYVAKIDAKLASGSYATKTDESVATLKEHLELAKLALTTAKSQEELTKAYRRLFMTVNSGLRSKPKAQVESPKLDTTEGKATVGKKASNTEKATGTNSIANSGKHDSRNRQALDRNNPFRTDATTTDTDPDAKQVFEEPGANEDVDGLLTKLNGLSNVINNETKLANMDQVAATKHITPGTVQELEEFGGWKAVRDSAGHGKFVVARKTANGVFPIETVNTVKLNDQTNRTWTSESVLDRGNEHVLLLSEVRTQATRTQEVFDKTEYKDNYEGNTIARGLTGYNGIEKTFKAFSPTVGSTTKISFKTGYTGDIDNTKAKYKVEVLGRTDETSTPVSLYSVIFDPSVKNTTPDMKVIAARNGNSSYIDTSRGSTSTDTLNTKLAERGKSPNGTTGTFTSKDIEIPPGYTEYTVRISSADNTRLGMGYQVPWRHFALPVAGLEFSITQDTKKVAKDLLTKVYTKLTEQKAEDTKWSTPETKANYEAKLRAIRDALTSDASTTDSYKTVAIHAVAQKKKLNEEEQIKKKAKDAVATKLTEKEQSIEDNGHLSPTEKARAKEQAREEASKANRVIAGADSQTAVTTAQTTGEADIQKVNPVGKEKAKKAIQDELAKKLQAINDNDKLSQAEKDTAKADATAKAQAQTEAIDKQPANADTADKANEAQTAVTTAQTTGEADIQKVNPVGKDKAKAAVDAALAEKDKAIDANDKLSDAEKSAAKEEAKKAADEAKKAIDAATDQAGVDAKATEGTDAVAAVNPVGKDKAKAAVDAALAEKDKAIDANDKLSDAEKSAAKEEAKKAADEAKKAIDAAADQAGVDAKEAEGKAEIAKVTPAAAVEVGKSAAKAEIEKAAKAKEAAIEANDKLSEAAKAAAKAQVAAEAKKAIEAIEKAATEADVEVAKEAGKAEIAKVAPATTDYKAKAKAEVEAELAKKLAELENATDLTEAEKAAAKAQVVNKAKEAIEAIQKAATEADVDQAIRNFVYRISAVIREQEEYDLSKLFVNGSVTVKQGESLTDKDVLSKLNLPSGVEIVKVEKPTTSALGTVMAKVTVKLADGSVEEINVPVEVIVSQNHGNEGNGANNGANNTEAKVNKAKLEGAIHQLDELLLKESAKLDAETAKEANVLSADAKKVFANADATQAEVDAMVKRIEDFMAKVAPSTDHANTANDQSAQTPAVVPANNQSVQTAVVAPATTQAAANASQTVSAQANARKAAKELPNTGTVNSTVAMVAAAASALLGLGLAGRRRKEDEEA